MIRRNVVLQDGTDTKGAFAHAGNMLKELKTTQLSPRNYYELYMKARSVFGFLAHHHYHPALI